MNLRELVENNRKLQLEDVGEVRITAAFFKRGTTPEWMTVEPVKGNDAEPESLDDGEDV